MRAIKLWSLRSRARVFVGIRQVSNIDPDGSAVLLNPNVIMAEPLDPVFYRVGRALVFATHRLTSRLPYELCVGAWLGTATVPNAGVIHMPAEEGLA